VAISRWRLLIYCMLRESFVIRVAHINIYYVLIDFSLIYSRMIHTNV
jgi:hypothetical protein